MTPKLDAVLLPVQLELVSMSNKILQSASNAIVNLVLSSTLTMVLVPVFLVFTLIQLKLSNVSLVVLFTALSATQPIQPSAQLV